MKYYVAIVMQYDIGEKLMISMIGEKYYHLPTKIPSEP